MIRVFIGYDRDEIAAYHTLANSIIRLSSLPVQITAVALHQLQLGRERDPKQSNDFAFSRWLVPHMCGYNGWAVWMDADMLLRADIAELWELRDPTKSVQVVKVDYNPPDGTKFLGRPQSHYPPLPNGEARKLWSAMMLMNCEAMALTPAFVREASGLHLHQFQFLRDAEIGELPAKWQHVVGVHDYDPDAALVHWTLGGPWWREYADTDYADEWFAEHERLVYERGLRHGHHIV